MISRGEQRGRGHQVTGRVEFGQGLLRRTEPNPHRLDVRSLGGFCGPVLCELVGREFRREATADVDLSDAALAVVVTP
jgi:hypothetical protein